MLQKPTIKFLRDLKKNNNKPWFDAHRKDYENAKAEFSNFIQQVIDQHGKKDPLIKNLSAKDCLFRINRDVRFSKDKSPYKTNFGASINKAGKSAWNSAGYYFHLEPGGCFTGGGIYMPPPDALKKLRLEIDYNFNDFKKILADKKFRSVFGDLDRSKEFLLTRVPKGYEPENPAADYLRLKSYIAMVEISDADLTSGSLLKKTTDAFEALRPLILFINNSMD